MSISVSGKVVFIGAGNVASHLAPAFDSLDGLEVVQVFSRSFDSAKRLADVLDSAVATDDVDSIIDDADIYVVSLVDDAVESLVSRFPIGEALWLHTSGSLPKEMLAPLSFRHGVFYPLQTFSRDVDVDISKVPIFIEGATYDVEREIFGLAERISDKVFVADGKRRRNMHIAAVFACNFVNHMWSVADDLLHEEGLSIEVLHPLLEETLRKAMMSSPSEGQTGPAMRGDNAVMERHISLLPPHLAKIYSLLSKSIYEYYHHEQN